MKSSISFATGFSWWTGLLGRQLWERVRDAEKYSFIEITITEGRNRQVRRMVEALRAKVLKLVRVRIGNIRIGDLQIGTTRELTSRR